MGTDRVAMATVNRDATVWRGNQPLIGDRVTAILEANFAVRRFPPKASCSNTPHSVLLLSN